MQKWKRKHAVNHNIGSNRQHTPHWPVDHACRTGHGRELRARQLTKILLNAPLLSLSRLHVTALMSQAHCVDGMVNYVELVCIRATPCGFRFRV